MVATTEGQKKEIRKDIEKTNSLWNEKIWTYLVAHLLTESQFRDYYASLFCRETLTLPSGMKVWYESEPIPPKKQEGNTKLDLAFGCIKQRKNTLLGIEYDAQYENSWVCFVEAKYFSDCSTTVSNDVLRNQIVRVIENLLCFQSDGKMPQRLVFTLLTPRLFQKNPKTRLYGYKMKEYENDQNILNDIKISGSKMKNRCQDNWKYPENIEERIKILKINWITYEDILEKEFNMSDLDITKLEDKRVQTISRFIAKIANGV